MDLPLISDDERQIRGADGVDLDRAIERPAQELHRFKDDVIDAYGLAIGDAGPGEGEEPARQLCGTARAGLDNFQVGKNGFLVVDLLTDEERVAQRGGEDVVEVVGDSPCQCTDALHLLRLHELALQYALFGHVPQDAVDDATSSVGPLVHASREQGSTGTALGRANLHLEFAYGPEGCKLLLEEGEAFRLEEEIAGQVPLLLLLSGDSEQLPSGGVEVDQPPVVVEGDHRVEDALEEGLVAPLRLRPPFLSVPQPRDVAGDDDDLPGCVARIRDERGGDEHGNEAIRHGAQMHLGVLYDACRRQTEEFLHRGPASLTVHELPQRSADEVPFRIPEGIRGRAVRPLDDAVGIHHEQHLPARAEAHQDLVIVFLERA